MTEPNRSQYFINSWIDSLALGGLSIVFFAVSTFFEISLSSSYNNAFTVVSILINYPHYSATIYRLYSNTDNLKTYRLTTYLCSALMILSLICSIIHPPVFLPALIKLYLTWSGYHYSGQTIGITILYGIRNNFIITKSSQVLLKIFVFGIYLYSTMTDNLLSIYETELPQLQFSPIVIKSVIAVTLVGGIAFIVKITWDCYQTRTTPSITFFIPVLAHLVWFANYGSPLARTIVPVFHCLQYLFITWSLQLSERFQTKNLTPSFSYFRNESFRWYSLNIIGGSGLFIAIPFIISNMNINYNICLAATVSVINIHHFIVDGVIWKLRRKSIINPLTMNWKQTVFENYVTKYS